MSVYKILSNNTLINGTIIRLPADEPPADDVTEEEPYDHEGAMQFIVATVLMYSILGVFCTLILRIKRSRGRGHQSYLQDESIVKYLKKETTLKHDGQKMKMMQECEVVSEQVRRYDERQKLIKLEREMSGDFSASAIVEKKSILKRKNRRKKKRELGNAISKMGVSLFYVGTSPNLEADDVVSHSDDSHVIELHNIASTSASPQSLKRAVHNSEVSTLLNDPAKSADSTITDEPMDGISYVDDETHKDNQSAINHNDHNIACSISIPTISLTHAETPL